jgi:hypothetical protein
MARNRNGMSMIVGTAMVLIISALVLLLLVMLLRDNFSIFDKRTESLLDTSAVAVAQQACNLACESESRFSYCCIKHEINEIDYNCEDKEIDISCGIDCEGLVCGDE